MAGAREGWFAPDQVDLLSSDGFGTFKSRNIRYKFLDAVYHQEAFRNEVDWPERFRSQTDEYAYIRDQGGIGYQLGEFYSVHMVGGNLDKKAGDGRNVPSAVPIMMDVERTNVRAGLAELWKRSNFGIKKDLITRTGATLGDVFIEVSDDVVKGRVRLKFVHPSRVLTVEEDDEGNVQAYQYQYKLVDPSGKTNWLVTYREEGTRLDADTVQYRTFKDDNLYAWPGNPGAIWTVPLPFIPLVKIQHKDMGIGWGEAEVAPSLSDWRELSDMGSCLTDWCRRALHSPHLISGMKKPEAADVEQYNRDEPAFLYSANPASSSKSLLVPLPVDGVSNHYWKMRDKMMSDYPELALQILQQHGNASGEAIRRAREPAQGKVHARRQTYLEGFERAFKMALHIAGVKGYKHYENINESSFENGELDFWIGTTAMFGVDPMDVLAEKERRFAAMKVATDAGLPRRAVLREFGYDAQTIAQIESDAEAEGQANLARVQANQRFALADIPSDQAQ